MVLSLMALCISTTSQNTKFHFLTDKQQCSKTTIQHLLIFSCHSHSAELLESKLILFDFSVSDRDLPIKIVTAVWRCNLFDNYQYFFSSAFTMVWIKSFLMLLSEFLLFLMWYLRWLLSQLHNFEYSFEFSFLEIVHKTNSPTPPSLINSNFPN